MTEKIIHKELSYVVNGCVFDVHNDVGPGLREQCYQKALEHRLGEAGLSFLAKPTTRRELIYRGTVVDIFEPDLIVSERIILELKHQPEGFVPDNFTQILSYLKFWDLRLGLLVNFALDKAVIERIPFDPKETAIEENYDYIRDQIRPEHRQPLRAIRESLIEIHGQIGAGYAATTYRTLATVELQSRGLKCESEVEVTPDFRDCRLPSSRISPLIVEGCIAVEIDAIYDDISARAIRTMQTHLRMAGCQLGLIACFGKTRFMIRGVRRSDQRI